MAQLCRHGAAADAARRDAPNARRLRPRRLFARWPSSSRRSGCSGTGCGSRRRWPSSLCGSRRRRLANASASDVAGGRCCRCSSRSLSALEGTAPARSPRCAARGWRRVGRRRGRAPRTTPRSAMPSLAGDEAPAAQVAAAVGRSHRPAACLARPAPAALGLFGYPGRPDDARRHHRLRLGQSALGHQGLRARRARSRHCGRRSS